MEANGLPGFLERKKNIEKECFPVDNRLNICYDSILCCFYLFMSLTSLCRLQASLCCEVGYSLLQQRRFAHVVPYPTQRHRVDRFDAYSGVCQGTGPEYDQ